MGFLAKTEIAFDLPGNFVGYNPDFKRVFRLNETAVVSPRQRPAIS